MVPVDAIEPGPGSPIHEPKTPVEEAVNTDLEPGLGAELLGLEGRKAEGGQCPEVEAADELPLSPEPTREDFDGAEKAEVSSPVSVASQSGPMTPTVQETPLKDPPPPVYVSPKAKVKAEKPPQAKAKATAKKAAAKKPAKKASPPKKASPKTKAKAKAKSKAVRGSKENAGSKTHEVLKKLHSVSRFQEFLFKFPVMSCKFWSGRDRHSSGIQCGLEQSTGRR